MSKKFKLLFALISISLCLGLMSNTYSRYVADASGDINLAFSKWQLLVNNTDITTSSSSNIEFTPVMEENANVKNDTVAPSSTGYFDINIDPNNVEVSFIYTITLSVLNENIPDLMITRYAILPTDYIEGDPLDFITLTENTISNELIFDNETPDFSFNQISIRIYFEWFEGDGELMDDESDTAVGNDATINGTTLDLSANIKFEQKL
ncbi:MAG: hypothetical protein PHD02_02095 [Bacilli bacterium]|nr:hypothetical protein [Bacilli bacterium]